jgi:hypothetical protein
MIKEFDLCMLVDVGKSDMMKSMIDKGQGAKRGISEGASLVNRMGLF